MFLIDCNVFKPITAITAIYTTVQLYRYCNDSIQNSLVGTTLDILSICRKDLLESIESTVTKRSNSTVYQIDFASITQDQYESIQDYLFCVKSSAPDC